MWDDVVSGLGLRIYETGARSFFWLGRIRGRGELVRVTLGPYPALTLKKAREDAREALHAALRGEDPREPRRRKAAGAKRTFEVVARDFIDRYVKRERELRTADEVERRIEVYLVKAWRRRPIAEITRGDVIQLLDDLVEDGMRVGANRIFATARKLFNWALTKELISASPCTGISAPVPERPRDRVLSDAEIRTVWLAASEAGTPAFGRFTWMLFATAQRRSEVAMMKRDEVDLERREWTIRAEKYKSERVHVVPLSGLAVEILTACEQIDDCPFFFSTNNRTPISGFNTAKEQIDEKVIALAERTQVTAVEGWTFHDARRTAASKMTELGIPRFIVERVLGHADRSLASVYDRYSYGAEKRDALERWSARLREIVK